MLSVVLSSVDPERLARLISPGPPENSVFTSLLEEQKVTKHYILTLFPTPIPHSRIQFGVQHPF
jgi:hypothetical protein